MDEKVLLAAAGLSVIIIGGSLYLRQIDFEGVRLSALNAHDRVVDHEEQVETSKASRAAMLVRESVVNKAIEELAGVEEGRKRIEGLTKERDSVIGEFSRAVKMVRVRAQEVLVPELTLKNGTKLLKAKLRKVEDGGVIFLHSEGVTRLTTELPEVLRARLRPDLDGKFAAIAASRLRPSTAAVGNANPLASESPPTSRNASGGSTVASQSFPGGSSLSVDPTKNGMAGGQADFQKTAALQSQATYLRSQISQLQTEQQHYLEKASTFTTRSGSRSGSSMGYGSLFTYRIHSDPAQAARAEAQAAEIGKQISTFQWQLSVIEAQMNSK